MSTPDMSLVGHTSPYFVRSVDHGCRTADDTARVIILTLESLGAKVPDDMRAIVDAEGWVDDGDKAQWLYELQFAMGQADGVYVDSSADCGMTWIYDLRGLSDDQLSAFSEAMEASEDY
jgi:hypothetical protein